MGKKQLKQQKPKPDLKRLGSVFKSIGGGFKDVALASASHPATAAIFVIGATGVLQLVTGAYNDEWRKKNHALDQLHVMLDNIMEGAKGIGIVATAIPVVTTALGTLGSVAQMKTAQAQAKAAQ